MCLIGMYAKTPVLTSTDMCDDNGHCVTVWIWVMCQKEMINLSLWRKYNKIFL